MAEESQDGVIRLKCVCGEQLQLAPELLGRIFPCPHCQRYLRPALQFLLVPEDRAPNITALCTCGLFIVEKVRRAGKTVKCPMCGQRIVVPEPVERGRGDKIVKVSRAALKRHVKRMRGRQQQAEEPGQLARLRRAGVQGRVSLRSDQQFCVNPNCGIPLPPGGNVCPRCGVNRVTGERYEGPGPEGDPAGKWKQIRKK